MKRITTLTVIILIIALFSQNAFPREIALHEKLPENSNTVSASVNFAFNTDDSVRAENRNSFVVSEKSEVENSVYLLGDATTVGWDNNNALEMEQIGDGVFEIVADIIDGPFIKFISVPGQWAPQWGTDESGTSTAGPLIYRPTLDVPDPANIPAPVEGQYRIRADVINLEYTIEPFLPKITFAVLDVNNDPIPDARILLNGQPYAEGEYVFEEMEAGNYHYTIWKDGMTSAQNTFEIVNEDITITEVLLVIPEEDYRFYLLGDATSAGWNNEAAIEMQSMGEGVFQTDVEIIQGNYIKFIAVAGQWNPQWGTDSTGTSASGELIYQPDPFSPFPEAIPAPSPGFYQVMADTVNNSYSVTPLFDTYTLTFNISNEDGMAVHDATIMLHGNTIYQPGEYIIEGLTEGNVTYTIWRTGYANQSGSIQIEQNTEIAITLASLPSGNSNVYLLGDATSAGWDNQSALPMNHLGNGVFEVFTEIINADGYIKFISEPGQWAPQWGTNETGTSVSGPLVYRPILDVPDPVNIPAPVNGIYRIRADVINLEYSIEPFTLPKITFVVLDVNNDPIPDARILLNGQPYAEGEYVFEGMEAGSYYYTVWKDGMTFAQNTFEVMNEDITLTEVLLVIPEEDYRFYLLGDATSAGWNNEAAIEMQSMGEGIFQTDVEIIQGDYIKFIAVAGQWEPQWGTDSTGTSASGELIYQPGPFSPTPEAIPAPSPGFYRIQADTINNTYSISNTTGLADTDQSYLKLYPNPARDEVRVHSTAEIAFIAIRDLAGKIVTEMEVRGSNATIPLTGLASGVFIVHVFSRDGVSIEKLIIDR